MEKPAFFRPVEIVLSLFSLAAIFWLVDVRKLYSTLSGADIYLVIAALSAYFLTMLMMSWRVRFIIDALGKKIGFGKAFFANAAGLLASDFTPARSGYFVVPFLLKKSSGVPLDKGMIAIVSPQIVDFFLKAAGAAAAIILLLYAIPSLSSSAIFLWAGVVAMLAFCVAMFAALFIPSSLHYMRMLSFIPFVSKGCDFIGSLQSHRGKVAGLFPAIAMISLVAFLLKGLEWYFFGLSLGINFSVGIHPFLIFLVLQPLITAFQFAPFPTIAGLGLSEGSAVASMALLGVDVELAVAYVLLVRGATTLLDCIGLGGLIGFFFAKKVDG